MFYRVHVLDYHYHCLQDALWIIRSSPLPLFLINVGQELPHDGENAIFGNPFLKVSFSMLPSELC